jgi:hypothetical protein
LRYEPLWKLIGTVILTHSFMVGLGMAALVTIQMGGVAQVSVVITDTLFLTDHSSSWSEKSA